MSVELKACPFCGAKVINKTPFIHLSHMIVHKKRCFFYIKDRGTTYLRPEEIKYWNTRASVEEGK